MERNSPKPVRESGSAFPLFGELGWTTLSCPQSKESSARRHGRRHGHPPAGHPPRPQASPPGATRVR
eukprot:3393089-Prymnesium_polylepis.1